MVILYGYRTMRRPSTTQKYMKALEITSPCFIKREVEEMTVAEAQKIWSYIKGKFPQVAALSGISLAGMKWGTLLRKMQWIKAKAESEEASG